MPDLLVHLRGPRPHEQLRAARTRHRHVRQATLLTLRMLAEGSTVFALQPLLKRGRRLLLALDIELEGRQIGLIPAPRVRQRAVIRHPSRRLGRLIPPRPRLAPMRREHAVTHAKVDDAVPLQTLRAVNRQDLHGLGVRLAERRIESILALIRHIQIGQERPKGRTGRLLLVGRSHGDELVQRGAPTHR